GHDVRVVGRVDGDRVLGFVSEGRTRVDVRRSNGTGRRHGHGEDGSECDDDRRGSRDDPEQSSAHPSPSFQPAPWGRLIVGGMAYFSPTARGRSPPILAPRRPTLPRPTGHASLGALLFAPLSGSPTFTRREVPGGSAIKPA